MKFKDGIPIPEYVHANEIEEEHNLSTIALYGDFQERLHQFRSDIMLLIMKHDALNPEASWLVFDHAEESDDGPVLLCPRTDICIATKTIEVLKNNKKLFRPHIRIMVNEAYSFEDGTEYVVTDVLVDEDDDTQYFVGPLPNRESSSFLGVETSLFFVNDGELTLFSPGKQARSFPPIVEIEDTVGDCEDETVIPFGKFTNIEDKIHALSVANGILQLVKDRVPLYQSSN